MALILGLSACDSKSPSPSAPPEAQGGSSAATPEPSEDPEPDESEDDEGEDEDDGGGFVHNPDIDGIGEGCDLFAQDCPSGHKCTVWANDGSSSPNSTRCIAIAPDAGDKGDPCWAANDTGAGWTGMDNCGLGLICWDIDPETGIGMCLPLCEGNASDPYCSDPDEVCAFGKSVSICFPKCQPLEDECPSGCGCYAMNEMLSCVPDASGDMGAYGDPCEFVNACDPGHACVNPDAVPGCEGSTGCCTTFCDLTAPDCPDAELGVTCVPWFDPDGDVDPDYVDLGACALEDWGQ